MTKRNMKTISVFEGVNNRKQPRVVRVRHYNDLDEYVCEVTDAGKRRDALDYFTGTKVDALATAAEMVRP